MDNLLAAGIARAVTINGLLDPIERAKAIAQVANGSASILYISPESLRSRTIERLLQGRMISRFVIDEAHCFSAWGHDFRPDYLYIGRFIRELSRSKLRAEPIPISCFTATAKYQVVEDIREYFKRYLGLDLHLFSTSTVRPNLYFNVVEKRADAEKYIALRDLLHEKQCPTIVYTSRVKRTVRIAAQLRADGIPALPYHRRMEAAEKTANQDAFMSGAVSVMVATTAFGMGVDKKDVGLVVHFDISDSLENYVQEAGRAGRDERISAECRVLFNEEDLDKHFILLNQTKINLKEIKQIWMAIKGMTRTRPTMRNSALEIARQAGWDDSGRDMETRVTTAVTALEQAGFLRRDRNYPQIFAISIACNSMIEASKVIEASTRFSDAEQRRFAAAIMSRLFSARSIKRAQDHEEGETRVDYLADTLGLPTGRVYQLVNILREEGLLAMSNDMKAFIKAGDNGERAVRSLGEFVAIERVLLDEVGREERLYHLKELNVRLIEAGCTVCTVKKLLTVLNLWEAMNVVKRATRVGSRFAMTRVIPDAGARAQINKRTILATGIIRLLCLKAQAKAGNAPKAAEELPVEFSPIELGNALNKDTIFAELNATTQEVEDAIFYLTRLGVMQIEGGFLVVHNKMSIERLNMDPRSHYTKSDYQQLEQFYENRIIQIHIVGEYARKMMTDPKGAQQFVNDYFTLNFSSFLSKYFSTTRQQEIRRNLTPKKYRELFETLTEAQRQIIDDKHSRAIVVAAGPGSGKTKLLVHKLAALLLMEDVKHEQLLMLTFSRAAATEFKVRLLELIGNAAAFVTIKTFHSYSFDLLGRICSIEEEGSTVVKEAADAIERGEIEPSRIAKAVLVIDEAQDMDENDAALVRALMSKNEGLRVIAVGDDDQNIFEFRGSSAKYMATLLDWQRTTKYELSINFRAKRNLVSLTNQFIAPLPNRMKRVPIQSSSTKDGQIIYVQCQSPHLAEPVVNAIQRAELSGSTAVLTSTNTEAALIAGLLRQQGYPVKLVQSNSDFRLSDLVEVSAFRDRIATHIKVPDEVWTAARFDIRKAYPASNGAALLSSILGAFEAANPEHRYVSDFDVFLRESSMEDFSGNGQSGVVVVSTMHKAKGREFDNVFLACAAKSKGERISDEDRRALYVALTRAKNKLVIFTNYPLLEGVSVSSFERRSDPTQYEESSQFPIYLTHRDIYLNYVTRVQKELRALEPDALLVPVADGLTDQRGRLLVRYSKQFLDVLAGHQSHGRVPIAGEINFKLWWKSREADQYYVVLLPLLFLAPTPDTQLKSE